MSCLPTDIQNLVSSYVPEAALYFPYERQRHVVREITGYLPSNPQVTREYLENPSIGVLTQDVEILPRLQERVEQDTGVFVEDPAVLREYLDREDRDTMAWHILARDPTTWTRLREILGEEDFLAMLLHVGTHAALVENLTNTAREIHELNPEEIRTYFLAALRLHDWAELLHFIEEAEYSPVGDYDNPGDRQALFRFTPEEVRLMVELEDHGADDLTTFFPPIYYLERAVPEFLYYMSLLSPEYRTIVMSNLAGWGGVEFDAQNPVIQAYMQTYPDTRETRAILEGGRDALHGINYGGDRNLPSLDDLGWIHG